MDVLEQLQTLDQQTVAGLARQVLERDDFMLGPWLAASLGYVVLNDVSGGLYRVRGTATAGHETLPWSVILKVVQAPAQPGPLGRSTDPHHYNFWRREPLLYASTVLPIEQVGLRAPRCFGVVEQHSEVYWIWLEDIPDTYDLQWPIARYRLAARHLARFNGTYLVGQFLPDVPWLTTQIERLWSTEFESMVQPTFEFIQQTRTWEHPLTRPFHPRSTVTPLLEVWQERERYWTKLQDLPQTFCHFDAMQPNLMAIDQERGTEQTVAIDWAFAGTGAVGSEIGPLVIGSLCFNKVQGAHAFQLDEQVFAGYLEGLHDVGYQSNPETIRFAYVVNAIFRFGILLPFWLQAAMEEQQGVPVEEIWGRSRDELIEQGATTTAYVVHLAEEAQKLLVNV